jgi:hypothetical protein
MAVDYNLFNLRKTAMPKNTKIRIKIELVETDDLIQNDPLKGSDGSFSLVIDEAKAISIDQIEKSVLTANWPAIRDAIGQHLTEVSKKKLKKKKSTGK